MHKKLLAILTLFSALLIASVATNTNAQTLDSRHFGERFVIKDIAQIRDAEYTYSAIYGNGNFGTLSQLNQAGFIDSALASREKHGYRFALSLILSSPGTPASFILTATPIRYPKTGRRSFYIDTNGELHGADKNGAVATAADPYIDSCALFGIADNERCTIADMRTLHGAEMTYASTYGNNNYATLGQLSEYSFIRPSLADGIDHGYSFTVVTIAQTQQTPATFKIYATPLTYGVTGIRSFFIDTSGIIRGADKNGLPADENDPPINN